MNDMEVKKYRILALFGKSGSGKDTIQNWVVSHLPNSQKIIHYTTRPKRDNEIDGEDYYFVDINDFTNKLLNTNCIEATIFNNWGYGTSIEQLDINKINVGVFNLQALEIMLQDTRLDVLPVYIQCNDKERLLRVLQREHQVNCHEVCRRFLADEKDFNAILPESHVCFDNTAHKLYKINNRFLKHPDIEAWLTKND